MSQMYGLYMTIAGSKLHVASRPNTSALCGVWVTSRVDPHASVISTCSRCALYSKRIEVDSEGSAA